jgi:uncharacterized membrane protein YecN with MAPEG domain
MEKRAELAGSTGAGVLGVALGTLLAQWTASYAGVLLVFGALLHGWGMLERRRLDAGAQLPLWSSALYWLCWIVLAALVIWIAIKALEG